MNNKRFEEVLIQYKNFLKIQDIKINSLRLETQVESLKDWSLTGSLEDTKDWYLRQQERCEMTIENIPLNSCKGWSVENETGNIVHESGDFFYVQGVRVRSSEDREVKYGWDQPILTQVGYYGGILGLLRKRIHGVPHYLVEAKAEPGNPDKVQISPTLQATFANLKQSHGGKKPRFAEYFEDSETNLGTILFSQWMSEDGGRLHLKRNKGMLVEVEDMAHFQIPKNFRWVSLYQLKELIKENSWVNPHIRGIISSL